MQLCRIRGMIALFAPRKADFQEFRIKMNALSLLEIGRCEMIPSKPDYIHWIPLPDTSLQLLYELNSKLRRILFAEKKRYHWEDQRLILLR